MTMRASMLARNYPLVARSMPMTSVAQQQMKDFWKKNQELKRPSSPWIIYKPHLPMLTSLTHRVTGIGMGVALYGISIGLFLAPGDFPMYIEAIKGLELSPLIMFPAKSIVAFPLIYHYINGIRHLLWDVGYGYELGTQYKSGYAIYSLCIALAALAGGASYMM